MSKQKLLALDIGEKRIGVAMADQSVPIAVPYGALDVDGREVQQIFELLIANDVGKLVVGYPRNQQGEPTAQTAYVERFVEQLYDAPCQIVYQDESLTSVIAEQRLEAQKKPYQKGDIDALAACLILEDYIGQ